MSNKNCKKRRARKSSSALGKRLTGYSLAAGAVLAGGSPDRSDVVYCGPLDQSFGDQKKGPCHFSPINPSSAPHEYWILGHFGGPKTGFLGSNR